MRVVAVVTVKGEGVVVSIIYMNERVTYAASKCKLKFKNYINIKSILEEYEHLISTEAFEVKAALLS